MGVHQHGGTPLGALTPICNDCGISLCWDIALEEYEEDREFWDRWACQDCREFEGLERMSLKTWRQDREKEVVPVAHDPPPARASSFKGMRPMVMQRPNGNRR